MRIGVRMAAFTLIQMNHIKKAITVCSYLTNPAKCDHTISDTFLMFFRCSKDC